MTQPTAAAAPPAPRNPLLARLSGALVRAFESASFRGAPTILSFLSSSPLLRRTTARARLATGQLIAFPAFDAYWCRYVWANAPYERDVEQIFRKLGSGRVLLDCGANIGYWSIRAPEFGFTKVIAIEANGDLIPILRENFRLNATNGTVHHAAVYSKSGEKLFLDRTAAHEQGGIGESGMPVVSMTIADAIKEISPAEEVVAKLDVEGAEIPALEGAEGVGNIIYVYEDFARLGMKVTDYLLARGMAVFGVTPEGEHSRVGTLDEAFAFSSATALPGGPSNLVACSAERAPLVEKELSRAG